MWKETIADLRRSPRRLLGLLSTDRALPLSLLHEVALDCAWLVLRCEDARGRALPMVYREALDAKARWARTNQGAESLLALTAKVTQTHQQIASTWQVTQGFGDRQGTLRMISHVADHLFRNSGFALLAGGVVVSALSREYSSVGWTVFSTARAFFEEVHRVEFSSQFCEGTELPSKEEKQRQLHQFLVGLFGEFEGMKPWAKLDQTDDLWELEQTWQSWVCHRVIAHLEALQAGRVGFLQRLQERHRRLEFKEMDAWRLQLEETLFSED